MSKHMLLAIAAFGLAVLFTACSSGEPQKTISKELGTDVSQGRVVSEFNSRGGFHGDGKTCVALQFSDTGVLEEIKESSRWQALPFEKAIQGLVYGITEGTSQIGPFLADEEGKPLVPELREGYYLLIDEQAEPGKATGADILHRASFNFTLGLYDTATNTLYYCRLDT